MTISIIITTYNAPDWLEKVLWGYQQQSYRDFEVVIADDGSGPATRDLIDRMRGEVFFPIQHIWHEDIGFRKCTILNQAARMECPHGGALQQSANLVANKSF